MKKEKRKQTDTQRAEGRTSATQIEGEREREYQLFSEGNVKLPWIRQTAASSPEKRENELE